jgi:hypothetical protein
LARRKTMAVGMVNPKVAEFAQVRQLHEAGRLTEKESWYPKADIRAS